MGELPRTNGKRKYAASKVAVPEAIMPAETRCMVPAASPVTTRTRFRMGEPSSILPISPASDVEAAATSK